jgi:hypothetical protein
MNIIDIITINYPSAIYPINYLISDDYSSITNWNVPNETEPTSTQLLAWKTDPTTVQAYKLRQNAIQNAPIIAQLQALDLQSIRCLREPDAAKLASITAQAVALRATLLPTVVTT